MLRTHLSALASTPGTTLIWATAIVAAVALALPYLDGVATAFGFVALPLKMLAASFAIVLVYVLATEWAKRAFYARRRA